METSVMIGLYERLSDFGKAEAVDFLRFLVERERSRTEAENREFLAKLERSDRQIRSGQVVVKTLEELEAMAQ